MSNATSLHENVTESPILWFRYPECAVAPYAYIFYFGVKVFNLALGTPSNLFVMWQVATKKGDTCTSDIFILSLAVVDVFFCLKTPIDLTNTLLVNDYRIWHYMKFMYGAKDLSPLFLVCISLDRYIAVVYPVLFTGIRNNYMIRSCVCLFVWGLVLAHGIAKSILGRMVTMGVFSGVILFAFAVMVFCNLSVVWALRRSVMGKEEMHPVKKRAFKMVLINLAIIVVNYLPPVALMPFTPYYTFVQFNCQITTSVYAIMDLSCSIEPLLYITKMERMNKGRCGICCSNSRRADSKEPSNQKS